MTLAERTRVTEVMAQEVVCVSIHDSVERLRGIFLERGISGVPVVDDGRAVGIVSKTDLVRAEYGEPAVGPTLQVPTDDGHRHELGDGFHEETMPQATAGDLMTPVVFSIEESTSIANAAALMAFENIHRLPVVDRDARVVGLVSSLDVLRWIAKSDGYLRDRTVEDRP